MSVGQRSRRGERSFGCELVPHFDDSSCPPPLVVLCTLDRATEEEEAGISCVKLAASSTEVSDGDDAGDLPLFCRNASVAPSFMPPGSVFFCCSIRWSRR